MNNNDRNQLSCKHSVNVKISQPFFFGALIVMNLIMAYFVRDTRFEIQPDFHFHNLWALDIVENGFDLSNLFHNLTAFFVRFLNREVHVAAGLTVFIMRMLFTAAVYYWARHYLKQFGDKWVCFCVLLATFGGSVPNLISAHFMYYYAFGVNVWHNPTTYTVMPFVIISFFLFCRAVSILIEDGMGKKFYLTCIYLSIALVLSTYGKGSWLPPFAMSALIFLIILWAQSKFGLKRMAACAIIGLAFIPAGLHLIYISANTIYQTNIVFGITSFIRPFPILLNLIFPLFVLFLRRKSIFKRPLYQMAWLTYACALLQGIFLIEPGREAAGNLTWAILYSLIVLLIVSFIEFVSHLSEKSDVKPWVSNTGVALASIYCVSGLFYAFSYLLDLWWY